MISKGIHTKNVTECRVRGAHVWVRYVRIAPSDRMLTSDVRTMNQKDCDWLLRTHQVGALTHFAMCPFSYLFHTWHVHVPPVPWSPIFLLLLTICNLPRLGPALCPVTSTLCWDHVRHATIFYADLSHPVLRWLVP